MNKNQIVKTISKQIYKQYPEFEGIRPKVSHVTGENESYTITYETSVTTSTGKEMLRRVKATVDSSGKILKISGTK